MRKKSRKQKEIEEKENKYQEIYDFQIYSWPFISYISVTKKVVEMVIICRQRLNDCTSIWVVDDFVDFFCIPYISLSWNRCYHCLLSTGGTILIWNGEQCIKLCLHPNNHKHSREKSDELLGAVALDITHRYTDSHCVYCIANGIRMMRTKIITRIKYVIIVKVIVCQCISHFLWYFSKSAHHTCNDGYNGTSFGLHTDWSVTNDTILKDNGHIINRIFPPAPIFWRRIQVIYPWEEPNSKSPLSHTFFCDQPNVRRKRTRHRTKD